MTYEDIKNIALAYTVKTSSANSQEQFLSDYKENFELFNELCKSNEKVYDFKI